MWPRFDSTMRDVFVLCFLEGTAPRDVATLLEISPNTVYSRIYYPAARRVSGPGPSPELCLLGDEVVACAWLALVDRDLVCVSGSDECFPGLAPGQGDLDMDITYDEATDSFQGSIDGGRVQLSRVE